MRTGFLTPCQKIDNFKKLDQNEIFPQDSIQTAIDSQGQNQSLKYSLRTNEQ